MSKQHPDTRGNAQGATGTPDLSPYTDSNPPQGGRRAGKPSTGQRQQTPRAAQQQRPAPRPIVHPPRLLPATGWTKAWWEIRKLFDSNTPPPKLNKREIAELERITEQERRESVRRESIAQLRQLKDEVPDFTVAFLNTKGAAATTTTAVHTASVVGDITRSVLLLLDANPASGTSAARLGKDRGETLTVGGLNDEFEMMNTFKRFIRKISPTRYSVRPVSSDSVVTDDRDLESMEMSKLLGGLQANSEYLFVDTANVITNKTSLAVVSAADVLVFTANVAVHDSLRQLGTTMETLRRRGFVDKVNNSVVVISNLPPGADLDDYRKFQHDVNLRDKVTKEYPGHIGSFMSVPYDLLITRDQEVDLGALNWETFQAYLEIGIAIFSQAKLLAHG